MGKDMNNSWRGYTDGKQHMKRCSTSIGMESESCSIVSDSLQPHGLYSPWNSPGQNTGVGSCSLLQEIFSTQGSNPCLPHCRWILYHLSHRDAQREFPQLETRCPSSALTVLHCQETPVPSPSLNAQCPQLALPPTIQRQHQSLHPAFNLSQHQGLFQWVSSLHWVAKVLELQLQHQYTRETADYMTLSQ